MSGRYVVLQPLGGFSWSLTGLVFPDSGTYVIDGGLSTRTFNTEKDHGIYQEPGIWVRRC